MGSAVCDVLLFIFMKALKADRLSYNYELWHMTKAKCKKCVQESEYFFRKKKQYFCSLYHYVTKAKWRQCTQEFIAPSLQTLNSRALKRVKVYIKFGGWQWQKVKQTYSNWTEEAFWTGCRLNVIYIGQIIFLRPRLKTQIFFPYLCLSYW